MSVADLHIHTQSSDGRWSFGEILSAAERRGLAAIAITDHDTIDGFCSLSDVSSIYSGEVIPGIEFNTETELSEVHILGYHFDITNSLLTNTLVELRVARVKRIEQMVHKLNKLGFSLTFEQVLDKAGSSKSLGRPHVAAVMLDKGYISTTAEAFEGLIAKGGPAYVPHYKLKPSEAIEIILAAKGIPVVAHPGLLKEAYYVRTLISLGVMGLEAFHPKHDKATVNHFIQLARQHDLILTGGSDFHAIPGRFPEDLGEFTIPYSLVEILNERHRSRI